MEVPAISNPLESHEKPKEVPDILCNKTESKYLLENIAASSDFKYEGKGSRRKADRPRKRKRDCDSDDDDTTSDPFSRNHINESNSESVLENSFDNSDALNLSACEKDSLSVSLHKESGTFSDIAGESPEDLSVRSTCDRSSNADRLQNMYKISELRTSTDPHLPGGSHSVRELEKIMSKHFPSGTRERANSTELADSGKQKSTIQWIGSSNAISTDSMTASAFLRQLYTSRESVIRSNHGRPCVYNGDLSSLNMLTPPGTELFRDPLQLNIPQIAVQNRSVYNSQSPNSLVSSTNDAFSMTPPSSVSPQEKVVSPFHDNAITDNVIMQYGAHAPDDLVQNRNSLSSVVQPDNSRLSFVSLPNSYQHENASDFHNCGHPTGQPGSIMNYNTRPASNSIWYGSAYTS